MEWILHCNQKLKKKNKNTIIPSCLLIILSFFLLVDPSVALKIERVLCSADTATCRKVLLVVPVGIVEVETVPCGKVLWVEPVGVVEVEKVPCRRFLVVIPVEEVLIEVEIVPCGVILVVVTVGVVEVVSGL